MRTLIAAFAGIFLCACSGPGSDIQSVSEVTSTEQEHTEASRTTEDAADTTEFEETAETATVTAAREIKEEETEFTAVQETVQEYVPFVPGTITQDEKDFLKKLIADYLTYEERELDENADLWADFDLLFYNYPQHTDIWLNIVQKWDKTVQSGRSGFVLDEPNLQSLDGLCIVVLGFRLNSDGSIAPELEGRLKKAQELSEKYPKAFILCTGGNTNATRSEALAMKEWLAINGVDPAKILTEERSRDTAENAKYSYEVLKQYPELRHLLIVSSHYHIQGATQLFQEMCALSGDYLDVVGSVPCESKLDTSYTASTLAGWMLKLFETFG